MTSNKTFHRLLSMLLLICMLMSLTPATAFAEESAEAEEAAFAEAVEMTEEEPAAEEEAADEPEVLPAEEPAAPEEAADEPEALPAEEAAAPEEAADEPEALPAEEAAAPEEAADEPEPLPAEEAEACTITYTDGEGRVLATLTAEYGSETPTIENPTREGYRFDRWEPALAETVTGDATYAAQWVKTWTLHFAGYEAYDITVDEGETASFAFVSGGLTQRYSLKDTDELQFLGWDTDPNAAHDQVTYAKYTNGQKDTNKGPFSVEMTGDFTLYPIFGAKYVLTAMHNDGTENYLNTNDAKPGTYAYLMIGTRPTRSGYTLLGYSRDKDAAVPDADLVKTSPNSTNRVYVYLEKDTTIWAVWEPISYTLTYDLNGGTGTLPEPVSFTLADGKDVALPAAEGYAKEGEIFLGWSFGTKISDLAWNKELTASNRNTFYEPGASIPASVLTAANKTIYAVWKYTGVTQNVDLNGGTKGPSGFPKTVNYGTEWSLPLMTTSYYKDVTLPDGTAAKNYIRGWYVVNDGTVHPHGNISAGANGKIIMTEDVSIMALYEYTLITFMDGEEELGSAFSHAEYSIPVYSFPESDAITPATLIDAPEKEGFTFKGWADDPSGEPVYQPGDTLSPLSDMQLYAVYDAITRTLSFDANGGDSAPDAVTVNYGSVVILKEAARAQYDFLGWATTADAAEAEFAAGDEFTVTEDLTLYAVWQHSAGWFKNDEGKWNYYDENGELFTGWLKTDAATYYLDENGVMLTGWQEIDGETYCFNPGGSMKTGWKKIDGAWYYFGKDGKMQTGFVQTYGNSYYMDENGRMLTGWQKLNGRWYYFDLDSGKMAVGWKKLDGTWYYFNSDGTMKTGWLEYNGKWYYLQSGGAMKTGWLKYNGRWYWFDQSGAMKTGWLKDGGYWYYFVESGAMAVSTTLTIDGVKYSFDASGHML